MAAALETYRSATGTDADPACRACRSGACWLHIGRTRRGDRALERPCIGISSKMFDCQSLVLTFLHRQDATPRPSRAPSSHLERAVEKRPEHAPAPPAGTSRASAGAGRTPDRRGGADRPPPRAPDPRRRLRLRGRGQPDRSAGAAGWHRDPAARRRSLGERGGDALLRLKASTDMLALAAARARPTRRRCAPPTRPSAPPPRRR